MRFQALRLPHWRQSIIALVLAFALLITGCQPKAPDRFAQAQQDSSKRGVTAVAKDATQGSEFNKFFPKSPTGYQSNFTQEKKGFAEAKLKRDGKDVAMLSISDTSSLPAAAAKYQNATEKISGYPAMKLGSTQTSVLVGKYQVKVLSRDPSFTEQDREAMISRFDLKGLERLKG
jgi:hypothetical protein